MAGTRRTILAVLCCPALVFAQAPRDDEKKVSNDGPGRPLQMAPASTEAKEALDDFDRFRRRGAWERALKALFTIRDDQALRFVDGDDNFIIPVARKRRLLLTGLPPEGLSAYRLFYDAEAKKLLEEAEGPAELAALERVYSAHFASSVGDEAADRLGALYFEQGRFDRAADCWLSILREYPDTDLPAAAIRLKAALALTRAERPAELEQVRAELRDRHGAETVTLGGRSGRPLELLRLLTGDEPVKADPTGSGTAAALSGPTLDLSGPVPPAWQFRFGELIEAGMTPPELKQWRATTLSGVSPVATVDGSTLHVNYLGHILALDLPSGKLLWRSEKFHNIELLAAQPAAQSVNPARFAVLASGDLVWTLSRDLKDQNFLAPFQLTCRRADNGEVVWKSTDLADYAQIDLTGTPLLADGKIFVAARSMPNPQQGERLPLQTVVAIRPHDGKVLWNREVGTFRQAQQRYVYYYGRDPAPVPRLLYRAGSLYVDTHLGVLVRLDADSGAVDWGFGYATTPYQGEMYFFSYQPSEPRAVSGEPLEAGESLLIKGAQSSRLCAINPYRMKLLWERPLSKSARLLGVDGRSLYLGGTEISALDLSNRGLTWATRLPGDSLQGTVLVRADGLWQLTPRGIFQIDPPSGKVRRVFRGEDLGAEAGDLVLAGEWLVSVSNRAITAYPRREAAGHASLERGPRPPAGGATSRAHASEHQQEATR